LFITRANAGDVDGLVALYESDAALACPGGQVAIGSEAIRRFYSTFLGDRPRLEPVIQRASLGRGELALTSSRLSNGDVPAEIARKQADGTWLGLSTSLPLRGKTERTTPRQILIPGIGELMVVVSRHQSVEVAL